MFFVCDKCGVNIDIQELQTRLEGELEVTFFVCHECNNEYIVMVTDEALRKGIKRYKRMTEVRSLNMSQGKTIPVTFNQKIANILKSNAKRGSQLLEEYNSSQRTYIESQPS